MKYGGVLWGSINGDSPISGWEFLPFSVDDRGSPILEIHGRIPLLHRVSDISCHRAHLPKLSLPGRGQGDGDRA